MNPEFLSKRPVWLSPRRNWAVLVGVVAGVVVGGGGAIAQAVSNDVPWMALVGLVPVLQGVATRVKVWAEESVERVWKDAIELGRQEAAVIREASSEVPGAPEMLEAIQRVLGGR